MSIVTDIADAVAAELGEGEFSQAFTPLRKAVPVFELKDLKDWYKTLGKEFDPLK